LLRDETKLARPCDGLRSAAHVELAVDVERVSFRRADTNHQLVGNLAVGETGRQKRQHFKLTLAQRVNQRLVNRNFVILLEPRD
jgi:hypothetical protein